MVNKQHKQMRGEGEQVFLCATGMESMALSQRWEKERIAKIVRGSFEGLWSVPLPRNMTCAVNDGKGTKNNYKK
jgi:hypothetical protein